MRRVFCLAAIATLTVAAGCVLPNLLFREPAYPPVSSVKSRPGAHVILIAVDGLRPDAITPERTPTLYRLIRKGAYTPTAQNVLPPRTLPNHAAMLTGLTAENHGLTSNLYQGPRRLEVPTVFDRARAAGMSTALYYGKDKFLIFERRDSLNWAERRDGGDVAADFARDFRKAKWNLSMLCFPDADSAGHAHGWMSPQYLDAVRRIDGYLALALAGVDAAGLGDRVHILLTADHGGQGTNHAEDLAVNRTIPFLVVGPDVQPGTLTGPHGRRVSITDMAPTAARLLGLPDEPCDGRVLAGAFRTEPGAVAAVRTVATPAR
jgi:predicted AlkP superfamily pyrophosphatase or phosphodiesterase